MFFKISTRLTMFEIKIFIAKCVLDHSGSIPIKNRPKFFVFVNYSTYDSQFSKKMALRSIPRIIVLMQYAIRVLDFQTFKESIAFVILDPQILVFTVFATSVTSLEFLIFMKSLGKKNSVLFQNEGKD